MTVTAPNSNHELPRLVSIKSTTAIFLYVWIHKVNVANFHKEYELQALERQKFDTFQIHFTHLWFIILSAV